MFSYLTILEIQNLTSPIPNYKTTDSRYLAVRTIANNYFVALI